MKNTKLEGDTTRSDMEESIADYLREHVNNLPPPLQKVAHIKIISSDEYKLSTILKFQIITDEREAIPSVAKVYRKGRISGIADTKKAAEKEYSLLRTLYDLFSDQNRFGVPRAFLCIPEKNVLIMEDIKGKKLNEFIKSDLSWFSGLKKVDNVGAFCFRCGELLSYLQSKTQVGETKKFKKKDFQDLVFDKLQKVENLIPVRRLKKSIVSFINNRMFDQLEEKELIVVGRHNDFTPWNLVIENGKIVLLDFTDFDYGTLYDDLTLFLITLEWYKHSRKIPKHNIEKMENAFLNGYGIENYQEAFFKLFKLKSIVEVLSWANEFTIHHFYHELVRKRYIRFYVKLLEKYCRS